MVFLWIILYGCTHFAFSRNSWGLPLGMLAYVGAFLYWICTSGNHRMIHLQRMEAVRTGEVLLLVPLLSLPVANCWMNGFPEPDWKDTIVMLCASVTEELFFRGFLFHRLLKYGEQTAILTTSIFFAGMHLANFFSGVDLLYVAIQIFLSFCVSMHFCAMVLRWKSILPAMLIHCLINLTASDATPDPGMCCVLVLCGLVCLLCNARLSHKKEKRRVL